MVQRSGSRHGSRRLAVLVASAVLGLGAGAASAVAQLPGLPGGGSGQTTSTSTTSSPPPPAVPPAPPGLSATAAGQDASRRFESGDTTAVPPLGVAWRTDLGTELSYVLVADGRVFVSRLKSRGRAYGAYVDALDATDGHRLWSVELQQPYFAADLAYGSGRLFVVDRNGNMHALEAATGRELWQAQVGTFNGTPVVAGDLVYTEATQVTALDAATGARRWRAAFGDGPGDPALAGDRLYAREGCSLGAIDRRDGTVIWKRADPCPGGSGGHVLLWRDRVMVVGGGGPYRASDGEPVAGPRVDAVSGDLGFARDEKQTTAYSLPDGRELWHMPRADQLIGLPNLVLRLSGDQIAFHDLATGAQVWAARVIDHGWPQDIGGVSPLAAVGEGLVVVPAGSAVVALAPSPRGRPEPLVARLEGRPDRFVGDTVRVSGSSGSILAASQVHLEVDRFPFDGRYASVETAGTDNGGGWSGSTTIDRNVRLRVVTDDGRAVGDATVYAYPRIDLGDVRRSGNRVLLPVRVHLASDVRARGRSAVLYLVRVSRRRVDRLDARRLGGRGGVGRVTFRFHALAHVGRRDFVVACVKGAPRLGQGRADFFARACGRRTIRY